MSGPATGPRHLTRPSPRLHQTRTAARVRAPAGTLRGVQDALQPALGAGCPAAHKTPFDTSHLGRVAWAPKLGSGMRGGWQLAAVPVDLLLEVFVLGLQQGDPFLHPGVMLGEQAQ